MQAIEKEWRKRYGREPSPSEHATFSKLLSTYGADNVIYAITKAAHREADNPIGYIRNTLYGVAEDELFS